MAETTILLSRTGAAIISQTEPSNHIPFADGAVVSNDPNAQRFLLAQFSALPAEYQYKKLVKAWLGGGADPVDQECELALYRAGASDLTTVN